MVKIVGGNTADGVRRRVPLSLNRALERAHRQIRDRGAELAVLVESSLTSSSQVRSLSAPRLPTGRRNQLLPLSANEPRFSPVKRRRTAYFQYAACTVTSQMLCRRGP